MGRSARTAGAALLALLGVSAAAAQDLPLGPEFQVNTYTPGFQRYPSIGSAGEGSFVVVWESDGQDGSLTGIFGQRYDGSGVKTGSEFSVNTFTTINQYGQQVAVDASGKFLVVWYGLGPDGDGVFGRAYDASGAPVGDQFRVTDSYSAVHPAIASDRHGGFLVVWSDQPGSSGKDVYGQRFDTAGAKVGSEFPINTYTTGDQDDPAIAVDGFGDFIVVWDSVGQDGSGRGIFAQAFDATEGKVGSEFQVNTYTTQNQIGPRIAANARGDFVVAWTSRDHETSYPLLGYNVIGRRLDNSGIRLGPEFQLGPATGADRESPSVAVDADGSFLASWEEFTGATLRVFAQRFDREAGPFGGSFALNTYTSNDLTRPAVAADGRGYVASWSSFGQDGDGDAVIARRQTFRPVRLAVDAATNSGTSSDANGVLEPGETVLVQPTWANSGYNYVDLTGSTPTVFCIINSPCVLTANRSASYGVVPPDSIASCDGSSPTGCFTVGAGGPRPGTHWDGGFGEYINAGGGHQWTLHIGDSFSDVPRSEPFYRKIETMLHFGITSGCSATQYCPSTLVTRGEMAVFIAKAMTGSGNSVPATGMLSGILFGSSYNCSSGGNSLLLDIAPTDPVCKHAHYLAARNVTLGCGNNDFCPTETITRDAMASFIAKAILAPGGGDAVPATYTDPATLRSYSCVSGSAHLHFSDVPVSNSFCKHIHYLWARGIVDGCTATTYCPNAPVARDAMAKFIANGFGLALYGP